MPPFQIGDFQRVEVRGSLAALFARCRWFAIEVELVKEAVKDRRQNDAGDGYEGEAAKQGVERGEQFTAGRL